MAARTRYLTRLWTERRSETRWFGVPGFVLILASYPLLCAVRRDSLVFKVVLVGGTVMVTIWAVRTAIRTLDTASRDRSGAP